MENKNERKVSWKNWLIKRLLLDDSTREEVLNYIADNESDENLNDFEDNNEKNLIGNILQLHNKSVEDVMVPRAEIISIEKNQVMKEVLKIIDTESHSRMPVYKKNLDNVIGFLHVKDLLNNTSKENFKLESILREVLYVAPKSPILDLLKRMSWMTKEKCQTQTLSWLRCIAVVAKLLIFAPNIVNASVLTPHRAIYDMVMHSAEQGSGISSAYGTMVFSFHEGCADWSSETNVNLKILYDQGYDVTTEWAFANWEAKDGLWTLIRSIWRARSVGLLRANRAN